MFLNRVVICDETWVHMFEPATKCQSSVWEHLFSPSPMKAILTKSAAKVMSIVFCHIQEIIGYGHCVLSYTRNYLNTHCTSEDKGQW